MTTGSLPFGGTSSVVFPWSELADRFEIHPLQSTISPADAVGAERDRR
jgi:hypothetical protein